MKCTLSILILTTLFCIRLSSQESITPSTDSITKNPTKYLSPIEYAFMFHENTLWMLKTNYIGAVGIRLPISFEARIKNGFTINLSSSVTFFGKDIYSTLGLEPRWYYSMMKRNREKGIPFNLSGNYIGIGVSLLNIQSKTYDSYYAKWGIQRRYLKNGFIDMGITLSGDYNNSKEYFLSVGIGAQLGFGLAKDQSRLNTSELCPIIKCHESNKYILKSNLNNILSLNLYNDNKDFYFNPQIGYEKKIMETPFSIDTELGVRVNHSTFSTYAPTYVNGVEVERRLITESILSFYYSIQIEGRYYYNLNRRILKGKTGNGLSANYITMGVLNSRNEFDSNFRIRNYIPYIATGFQRLISDHMYYDVALTYQTSRLGSSKEFFTNSITNFTTAIESFASTLKVGYRF